MGLRPEHPLERAEVRNRLSDLLAGRPEIDFAYLFGSFQEGLPYSDVDVAVYLRPALPQEHILDYEMELSAWLTMALDLAVDVHVLNAAPMGFQHAVLQGEPLLVRDEERLADFIEYIGYEVMEFSHHAEEYLKEILS